MTPLRLKALCALIAISVAVAAGCSRRGEIAGTVNTKDFVIPAGQTLVATSDLTINATRRIQIDGTLYAAPGANLEFNSPIVRISGRVQNLNQRVSWWRERMISLKMSDPYAWLRRLNPFSQAPRYWPGRKVLDCFGGAAPSEPNPSQQPPR